MFWNICKKNWEGMTDLVIAIRCSCVSLSTYPCNELWSLLWSCGKLCWREGRITSQTASNYITRSSRSFHLLWQRWRTWEGLGMRLVGTCIYVHVVIIKGCHYWTIERGWITVCHEMLNYDIVPLHTYQYYYFIICCVCPLLTCGVKCLSVISGLYSWNWFMDWTVD